MFGKAINNKILKKAKTTDEEICGVIVDGRPIFIPNKSSNPKESFEISEIPNETQAVFHSHPGGPFYPSSLDIKQQSAMMIPWGIACYNDRHADVIWFGGEQTQPLVGRSFIHGVTDCYTLVQDFYKTVHSIELPDVPREWEWWDTDDNLYINGFEDSGFVEIDPAEVLPGDGFIATVGSKTPNHAGVFLGNGLILHHLGSRSGYDPTRLSVVEPAVRWHKFITKTLRYENNSIDRTVGQGIWD